jgi:hypothetical protein
MSGARPKQKTKKGVVFCDNNCTLTDEFCGASSLPVPTLRRSGVRGECYLL